MLSSIEMSAMNIYFRYQAGEVIVPILPHKPRPCSELLIHCDRLYRTRKALIMI